MFICDLIFTKDNRKDKGQPSTEGHLTAEEVCQAAAEKLRKIRQDKKQAMLGKEVEEKDKSPAFLMPPAARCDNQSCCSNDSRIQLSLNMTKNTSSSFIFPSPPPPSPGTFIAVESNDIIEESTNRGSPPKPISIPTTQPIPLSSVQALVKEEGPDTLTVSSAGLLQPQRNILRPPSATIYIRNPPKIMNAAIHASGSKVAENQLSRAQKCKPNGYQQHHVMCNKETNPSFPYVAVPSHLRAGLVPENPLCSSEACTPNLPPSVPYPNPNPVPGPIVPACPVCNPVLVPSGPRSVPNLKSNSDSVAAAPSRSPPAANAILNQPQRVSSFSTLLHVQLYMHI